jgi:hypothetical protein
MHLNFPNFLPLGLAKWVGAELNNTELCTLFVHIFGWVLFCTHVLKFVLHCKATWRQPCLSFVNETPPTFSGPLALLDKCAVLPRPGLQSVGPVPRSEWPVLEEWILWARSQNI